MKKAPIFILPLIMIMFLIYGIEQGIYYRYYNPFKGLKQSGALQAMEQWVKQRAYPDDDIPADKYYRAYEQHLTMAAKRQNVQAEDWQALGPKNIGGRTISIAIHPTQPDIIFAGAASGGLWKSTTGGVGVQAWEYIETGFPVNGVGAIAINYDSPDVMYIGTGEVYGYQNSIGGLSIRNTRGSYGIGLLKTTDGGTTWTKSIDWTYDQRRGVQVIKLHPEGPDTLFAGTTEGIYKSTNAGSSWVLVHPVVMVTDIVINQNNPQQILAACGNLNSTGTGIYRSTNGGATWAKITSGLPAAWGGKALLAASGAESDVVYASIGFGETSGAGTNLCKTTNFGATWTVINTQDYATYQGWFAHFVVPHETDPSKLLTAGVDVYKSINGGSTLTQKSYWFNWDFGVPPIGGPEGPPDYSHADHHAWAQHPTNPNIIYFGNDGGVFRTLDFGETFEGCNGGYQTTQFYKRIGVSRADSSRLVGGMQDNATAVWEGTAAWRRGIGGDGCCAQISPTSVDTMYGSSQYLNAARSFDKGVSWQGMSIPSSSAAFNGQFLVAPSNGKILYGGGKKFYRTTNGGNNWTALNGNQNINGDPVLSIAIAYNNPDIVYITTAPNVRPAEVFKSTNGGTVFTNITGNLPNRYPVDISVDPGNPDIVYVAFSGYGTSHLYRSTNGGAGWNDIGANLPDVPASAVVVDPLNPGHIYVGNDLGVYATTNLGESWININTGVPGSVLIMDLAYSPANRKLIAATHGRGVYSIPLPNLTNIHAEGVKPDNFVLGDAYPNPFNAGTNFEFTLPVKSSVVIRVYTTGGEMIYETNKGELEAGTHRQYIGTEVLSRLAGGVYYYAVQSGGSRQVKKFVYLK